MKAITLGSATVDIIATVADADIERMTLHNSTSSFLLLEPGRKVDASGIVTHTGGGAVNAAVSLARQGLDVAALIKVGDDHNAEKIVARLQEEGVSADLVRVCETESTAVSVMIASHDRNAAIFTHRGANGFLTEDDIPPEAFAAAGLVYVTNLSNDSANRFPNIVRRAKDAGAFVAANPGIRQLTGKTASFFESLAHIDFFTCNHDEARALVPALVDRTGWERHDTPVAIDDAAALTIEGFKLPLEEYFSRLHGLGPRFVAVTCGAGGAYVSDAGTVHFEPAQKVEVVGTVGAGDAFASTLAGCLARGMDVPDSAWCAARNASAVVGYVDAQEGLLPWAALTA